MKTSPELIIVALIIAAGISWLVYTLLIWFMLKIQRLNYTVLGLFASSALATLVSCVPIFGPFIAGVVLIACLRKCTKASIVPDLLFTVLIANALMFCFNLWVIGKLMGDLRPSRATAWKPPQKIRAAEPKAPSTTPKLHQALPSSWLNRDKTGQDRFVLKGIAYGSKSQMAMISYGGRIYNVGLGESLSVRTTEGLQSVLCETITPSTVVLRVNEQETITLTCE